MSYPFCFRGSSSLNIVASFTTALYAFVNEKKKIAEFYFNKIQSLNHCLSVYKLSTIETLICHTVCKVD